MRWPRLRMNCTRTWQTLHQTVPSMSRCPSAHSRVTLAMQRLGCFLITCKSSMQRNMFHNSKQVLKVDNPDILIHVHKVPNSHRLSHLNLKYKRAEHRQRCRLIIMRQRNPKVEGIRHWEQLQRSNCRKYLDISM